MKPETSFVAERMVARHCPQLLREGPAPADPLETAADLGARVARALPARLASLSGGDSPVVQAEKPRKADGAALAADAPTLAVHCLFAAGSRQSPLVVIVEGEAIFRLIDRAFGGTGRAPDPLPAAFPLSAELMIGRLESAVAAALADALGVAVVPLRRGESLGRLAAFPAGEPLAIADLAVIDGGEAPWRLSLAQSLKQPLAAAGGPSSSVATDAGEPAADPLAGPFGDVPLPLRAVLVDMAMPFSTLADLTPGQVIPVAVARSVPLETGGRAVACGTVGAMDDRVAVRVAQLS